MLTKKSFVFLLLFVYSNHFSVFMSCQPSVQYVTAINRHPVCTGCTGYRHCRIINLWCWKLIKFILENISKLAGLAGLFLVHGLELERRRRKSHIFSRPGVCAQISDRSVKLKKNTEIVHRRRRGSWGTGLLSILRM